MNRIFSGLFTVLLILSICTTAFASPLISGSLIAGNTDSVNPRITEFSGSNIIQPTISGSLSGPLTPHSPTIQSSQTAIPYGSNSLRILSPPLWLSSDTLLDNENIPTAVDDHMKNENEMGWCEPSGNNLKFVNSVDGYSIIIPSDMTVDMSRSDVCTTFADKHRMLRIFKETFTTSWDRLAYLTYSNKFIENTADHTIEKSETYGQGDYEYHILQWSRERLSRVENDKNYYACVDVCIGARVYTFFFTADTPFSQCGGYMDIVNSLLTFDPSIPLANAYNKGYKGVNTSRLNQAALSAYDKIFSDNAEFKMGLFTPDYRSDFEKMRELEKRFGYDFCAFLLYTEITDKSNPNTINYQEKSQTHLDLIETNLKYAQQNNKLIELTIQTPLGRAVSDNMVYEILDGEYDQFIEKYAELVATYSDVAVLVRPFNEMNGDWCPYSSYHTSRDPQIYVELYKYLYKKFKEAGCTNTIWVWNPNERSFPNFKWNHQDMYYPGDEYVDIYGITGYNNGTYYDGEIWRSFEEIYTPIYERALRINEKPMMITEFSCSSIGGDKIKWVEEMFSVLPKFDKIKLGIWWNSADYNGEEVARPYFIDSPDGLLDVFDKFLN